MTQLTISKAGLLGGGAAGLADAVRALARDNASRLLASHAAVTDNSGGTSQVSNSLYEGSFPGHLADNAASGSNLATVATVTTEIDAVQNATATLWTVVNTALGKLGLPTVTNNGGGTDGAGTVAAIATAVAGATTGPTAENVNPVIDSLNLSLYNLGVKIGSIAEAVGVSVTLDLSAFAPSFPSVMSTIAALTVDPGAAGANGVLATDWTAAMVKWQNLVATYAAVLNAANAAVGPRIIAVP